MNTAIKIFRHHRSRNIAITLATLGLIAAFFAISEVDSERVLAQGSALSCSIAQVTSQSTSGGSDVTIGDDGTELAISNIFDPLGTNTDLNREIFLYSIPNSTFNQLTNTVSGINRETGSSGGSGVIAFVSNRDLVGQNPDLNLEIFLYHYIDGLIQITNTFAPATNHVPRLSSDGNSIAFVSTADITGSNSDLNQEIFVFNRSANTFGQITDSFGAGSDCCAADFAALNFNGSRIAYKHFGDPVGLNPDGNSEIFMTDLATADTVQITDTTATGSFSLSPPVSNSGMTRIAFMSVADLTGENADGGRELFIYDDTTGLIDQITSNSYLNVFEPDLSADGAKLVFRGDNAIIHYDTLTGIFTPLTPSASGLFASSRPQISLNGKISFISNLDLTGGNPFNREEIFLATCTTITPTPTPTPTPPPTPTPTPLPTPENAVEKIVFHSQRDDGATREIYIMNSDGSEQRRLTYNTFDDMEPWLSRDGRKIVFQSDRGSGFDIYMMDVDGTDQINLTNNGAFNIQPSLSPDGGKVIFSSPQNGDFDVFSMNADGSGQTNLTAASQSYNADPVISPDGSKIAFRSDRDGNTELYVMNIDGSGQTRLTFTPTVFEEQPGFSPDGSRIVYNTEQDSTGEIWVMNADGTDAEQLTNNSASERHPFFSPDGSRIAFTSARDGNNEIYAMDVDGANQERLTVAFGSDYGAMWAITAAPPEPGTPKIVFTSRRNGTVWHIFTMDADGANQTPLTSGIADNIEPAWSPDGRKIAFTSERDGDLEIFVMNADGSNQVQLTFNTGLDYKPSWSPDGSKIAFTRKPLISSSTASIVTMLANGQGQTEITPPTTGLNEFPSWSPDGTKIAFTRIFTSDAQRDIYVVNADGSNSNNPLRLTDNFPLYDNFPDWSPDGTRIVHTCSDPVLPSNWEICSMNASNGQDLRRLTFDAANEVYSTWSADSQQIVFQSNRNGNTEIYSMRADGAYPVNLSNYSGSDSQPDWQPNVAWTAETETGSNVAVQMGLVSVAFSGVNQPGVTSQYAVDPGSLGPLPSGFTFGPGFPAYEITTSAAYTPPITVCIQVPTVNEPVAFGRLALFHYENGALRDRTSLRDFSTRTICAVVNSLSPFVVAEELGPSSTAVTVSGRVTSADGRGIGNVTVTLTDLSGVPLNGITNAFGYYRIDGVTSGQVYTLSASHRTQTFEPRLLVVDGEIADADLIATASPPAGKQSVIDRKTVPQNANEPNRTFTHSKAKIGELK